MCLDVSFNVLLCVRLCVCALVFVGLDLHVQLCVCLCFNLVLCVRVCGNNERLKIMMEKIR